MRLPMSARAVDDTEETISQAMPERGQIVRLRSRQYLVEDMVQPPRPGDATLVRMSCVDDDNQGQPLEVLWEKEIGPEILTAESWNRLAERGFDPPKLFAAYFHTLRWNCVTATDPNLFQAPFRAGIRLDAYQLEPLRKALLLPRVNLFIADDVGLGKTIEAGLIARELLLRKKVKDIVVACPPSMLLQWQDELESRFGLTFEILDKAYVARVRQERGYGVNPWSTHTRFLISHRLLIDETYTTPLRDWLGELRAGSLLILDEAHHAAPSSGAKYAIDSKITHAIRELAQHFEHRLFLSATPHNGHSNSFSALLEILDPQRFCRGVPVQAKLRDEVMVRRLKDDLREIAGGFPERKVSQIDIAGLPDDAPDLRLSRLLDQYRTLREARLMGETKRVQAAAGLLVTGLQQRLLSSIDAFARTLRVHRRTVLKQWEAQAAGRATAVAQRRPLDLLTQGVGSDDDRATLSEEELRAEEEAQIEAASLVAAGSLQGLEAKDLFAKEQKLLEEMTTIAEAARGLPDAKVQALLKWIKKYMCPGLPELGATPPAGPLAPWNDTRVIIFTEYEDTRRYLSQQLSAAIAFTDRAQERIAIYHGPTPLADREEIKRAFNANPKKHPVRILIATDAAREGLNLQTHCWNLFHFDVPWNPARMEQRNGRIDRKLQPKDEVFCYYFMYHQRVEDRILKVLVEKTERIKKELGSLAPVIEGRLAGILKLGIAHKDVATLERSLTEADLQAAHKGAVTKELEESRERQEKLREQIARLQNRLKDSKDWIALGEDHFRSAISCSLELMGADPLRPVTDGASQQPELPRYTFPALDRRAGADPSWSGTLDALRAPRKKDQTYWEWRRESPIRPVVFEDPGTMDEEVVHLHLEHRVVQRLLNRFRAQGFIHHDLSRACLAQTADPIPRVILLGRLCLFGPGGARLHEELIPVAARWIDPADRKRSLAPFGREAEGKTLDLLETALLPDRHRPIADRVLQRLRGSAMQDIQDLLPHLEARGREYGADAEQKLKERGRKESQAMREILETQKRRVAETAAKYHDPQLTLDLDVEEKRQVESNRRHWEKRLGTLEKELEVEPQRVLGFYDVRARRLEPVGLVYLWPVTG